MGSQPTKFNNSLPITFCIATLTNRWIHSTEVKVKILNSRHCYRTFSVFVRWFHGISVNIIEFHLCNEERCSLALLSAGAGPSPQRLENMHMICISTQNSWRRWHICLFFPAGTTPGLGAPLRRFRRFSVKCPGKMPCWLCRTWVCRHFDLMAFYTCWCTCFHDFGG